MAKTLITLTLLCASLSAQVTGSSGASTVEGSQNPGDSSAQSVNPVVLWNRTLLVIVRTPGAQPATVHSTRSFAIMHAAIYDAVNAIDGTHKTYLVGLSGVPRSASQDAAAAAAAHEVLLALYPAFQAALDAVLQQSLAQIPIGNDKLQGVAIGQTVAGLSWLCVAMTDPTLSPFLLSSATPREITSQLLLTSPSSLSSHTGLALLLSPWSASASFASVLPRR